METDSVVLEVSHCFSKAPLVLLISSQIWELPSTTSTIPVISAAVEMCFPFPSVHCNYPRQGHGWSLNSLIYFLRISEVDHLCWIPTTTDWVQAVIIHFLDYSNRLNVFPICLPVYLPHSHRMIDTELKCGCYLGEKLPNANSIESNLLGMAERPCVAQPSCLSVVLIYSCVLYPAHIHHAPLHFFAFSHRSLYRNNLWPFTRLPVIFNSGLLASWKPQQPSTLIPPRFLFPLLSTCNSEQFFNSILTTMH